MKLKKLTATFGALSGDSITLGDGLNVITAPNESGKSTWAGFLKSMLYGIDTKDRDKKGHLADKNRYLPWSGAPMAGEIDLDWGNRAITLRRWTAGATPFGKFSATYTGTDEPAALTAAHCGFSLTGVEREVFERSAFLGAASHAISAVPELERRIAALVSTGDETISFSQVEERLKEWGRLRRVNKSVGLIPKLEGQLTEVEAILHQQALLNGEIATLSATQKELHAQAKGLQAEMDGHNQWTTSRRNAKFLHAKEGLRVAQSQLDGLMQSATALEHPPTQDRLRHWQGELAVYNSLEKEWKQGESPLATARAEADEARKNLADNYFSGLTADDARALAGRECATHQGLEQDIAKLRHRPLIVSALAIIAAIALVVAVVQIPLPSYVAGGGGCALGSIWMARLLSIRGKKKEKRAQCAAILARYDAERPEQITARADGYAQRCQICDGAEEALRQQEFARKNLRDRADDLFARILDFVQTFAPTVSGALGCSAAISRQMKMGEDMAVAQSNLAGARRLYDAMASEGGTDEVVSPTAPEPTRPAYEIAAQLSAVQSELRRVEDSLSQLIGRQQAAGDPAALEAQREQLSEELTRRQRELDAISLALDGLRTANVALQQRFSPQLNAKAGEYLSYLTNGRYGALSLTRELEGSATLAGEVLPRTALALSRGTADQLYLAVRLAVCDLCLPEGEPVPLVLDDALVAFDQVRMKRALDLLCEMAQTRQILLFTCHSREAEYLSSRDNVTCITL